MPAHRRPDPFYLSAEWRRLRQRVLRAHPVCLDCEAVASSHVDHVKPRRLFPELAFDEQNLRALCASCHNRKSAREYAPHGFGLDGQPLDPAHPWHAGEAARVARPGAARAPEEWQRSTLRAAMMARDVPTSAHPGSRAVSTTLARAPSGDAAVSVLMALPAARRGAA